MTLQPCWAGEERAAIPMAKFRVFVGFSADNLGYFGKRPPLVMIVMLCTVMASSSVIGPFSASNGLHGYDIKCISNNNANCLEATVYKDVLGEVNTLFIFFKG